jgi:hypothetical protein
MFETALGYESGGRETCFDEKKCMQKISRYCPFKLPIVRLVQGDIRNDFKKQKIRVLATIIRSINGNRQSTCIRKVASFPITYIYVRTNVH